ncbi:MAG: hypothetical protein K9M44_00465 [Candidatus Pacebacteria bacterium]|nr:hypothetical protein [Candidatus Paceibacterota bacterium]
MSKYFKIIAQLLLWFFLVIFQISFISSLNFPFYNLPLLLSALSFLIIFKKDNQAIWLVFLVGFIFDIFFFYPFALFTLSLVVCFGILKFLQVNFLTNRSFYSVLALSLFFILVFNLVFNLFYFILNLTSAEINFFLFQATFWQDLAYQLFFAFILEVIFFYAISLKSRGLRSDFLERT